MKNKLIGLVALIAVAIMPSIASAAYCTNVAVTTSSTALLAVNDLGVGVPGGQQGRHTIFIHNIGPFTAYVAIGSSNAATTSIGFPLIPGNSMPAEAFLIPNQFQPGQFLAPTNADIAAIAIGGTTNMVVCDQ